MIQYSFKMSRLQGKLGIKIFQIVITSLIDIVIHRTTQYFYKIFKLRETLKWGGGRHKVFWNIYISMIMQSLTVKLQV